MSHVTLKNFFIYNDTFGTRECTEHEKLMYFSPSDVDRDSKMNFIGLSEALAKYTSTFSTEHPLDCLHTMKTRQAFFNPEPNFWISLTVNLPYSQKSNKEGKTVLEYHEDGVQDLVLKAVLRQAYWMYKLFNGTMTSVLEDVGKQALLDKLEIFYDEYLTTIDFTSLDLLDAFDGIRFLPLDKNTYLRVQCFINVTEASFSQIKYSVFLYNSHLVWSGLEQNDMRGLFRYLTGGLLNTETTSDKETKGSGKFVTGPENLQDLESPVSARRLYLSSEDGKHLFLIIYQCQNITCCFLIDGASLMDLTFYQRLHKFVNQQLIELNTSIGEQQTRRAKWDLSSTVDVHYRYLYFNHMNLASKTSFTTMRGNRAAIPQEFMPYLANIHADLNESEEGGEIIFKTQNDIWIVGIHSDRRELFVVFLNQKNADLIEISDEIRRLSATQFNNIFFID